MKIIKFSAVWCPGCLVMRPIWREVLQNIGDIEVIEYDYDIDEDEVEKYNIGDKLPVLILLDSNEKEVKRLVGEKTKEEILMFIKER